jgi:hypothetical protein
MYLHELPDGVLKPGDRLISAVGTPGRVIAVSYFADQGAKYNDSDAIWIKWENGNISATVEIVYPCFPDENSFGYVETIDYP